MARLVLIILPLQLPEKFQSFTIARYFARCGRVYKRVLPKGSNALLHVALELQHQLIGTFEWNSFLSFHYVEKTRSLSFIRMLSERSVVLDVEGFRYKKNYFVIFPDIDQFVFSRDSSLSEMLACKRRVYLLELVLVPKGQPGVQMDLNSSEIPDEIKKIVKEATKKKLMYNEKTANISANYPSKRSGYSDELIVFPPVNFNILPNLEQKLITGKQIIYTVSIEKMVISFT